MWRFTLLRDWPNMFFQCSPTSRPLQTFLIAFLLKPKLLSRLHSWKCWLWNAQDFAGEMSHWVRQAGWDYLVFLLTAGTDSCSRNVDNASSGGPFRLYAISIFSALQLSRRIRRNYNLIAKFILQKCKFANLKYHLRICAEASRCIFRPTCWIVDTIRALWHCVVIDPNTFPRSENFAKISKIGAKYPQVRKYPQIRGRWWKHMHWRLCHWRQKQHSLPFSFIHNLATSWEVIWRRVSRLKCIIDSLCIFCK